jgi:hypothetical protein
MISNLPLLSCIYSACKMSDIHLEVFCLFVSTDLVHRKHRIFVVIHTTSCMYTPFIKFTYYEYEWRSAGWHENSKRLSLGLVNYFYCRTERSNHCRNKMASKAETTKRVLCLLRCQSATVLKWVSHRFWKAIPTPWRMNIFVFAKARTVVTHTLGSPLWRVMADCTYLLPLQLTCFHKFSYYGKGVTEV